MKYKNLLFDLDGLLVDTGDGVFHCVRHALSPYGIEVPDEDKALYMGPPLKYSFVTFAHLPEEYVQEALDRYRALYDEVMISESRLYEGIDKMLAHLKEKGFYMCVATSKLDRYAEELLASLGVDRYFDLIGGADADGKLKNKSMVIEDVLRRSGITDKKDVLMIGDRLYDVEGAKALGIDSLGVYMGYAAEGEHEKAGATYVAVGVDGMEKTLLSFAE